MDRAGLLGLGAIAIADENSVAGIVRAHTRIRELHRLVKLRDRVGLIGPPAPAHLPKPSSADIRNVPRLIPATRLVTDRLFAVTMIPRDRAAWGRLCRLVTLGRRRAVKGACQIHISDLLDWGGGSELIVHPGGAHDWRETGGTAGRGLSRPGQPCGVAPV